MEPLSNGHFGTNVLSSVERLSSLRDSNHMILIGYTIWGFSLSIVERYLIQCPFLRGSSLRASSLSFAALDSPLLKQDHVIQK